LSELYSPAPAIVGKAMHKYAIYSFFFDSTRAHRCNNMHLMTAMTELDSQITHKVSLIILSIAGKKM
jgi:hypothetical protein